MREVWWHRSKGKEKREGGGLVISQLTMAGINGGSGERENIGREETVRWLWSFSVEEFDQSRRQVWVSGGRPDSERGERGRRGEGKGAA
ncbi:hypothetical protein HAX54_038543, partial [Datura stramonium]|nr:hypothetical protein [Datura stramonium]